MDRALMDAFDAGLLVRPGDGHPNLVHLVRAVATVAGVGDLDQHPAVADLVRTIGPTDHLIFILIDGLGMNLVERLPASTFLATSLRRELRATCPSTTACALTTVATASYPNRHGVTGWFTHLPEFGLTATTLPLVERYSGRPLAERGISVGQVLPVPSVLPRMTHEPATFTPAYITNTPYNNYARGGTPGVGYHAIPEAVDGLIRRVRSADRPTYTHLYLHDVDTRCHHVGTDHESVIALVLSIDRELARLHEATAGRATVVVTADHGLIDVPEDQQVLLRAGDPLLEVLAVPPTGDARMPVFHVRDGRHEAFADQFRQRFGDRMALVETAEAEREGFFGPGSISAMVRGRFGDYVAFPFRPATLAYHPPDKALGKLYLAVHAGLSPVEMRIPMCVGR
ncbi:MAG TPA: alkaline phosphatase family protein [Tepidisphaeraceae bacterium]|nr:alkaline phosphatase family protein [Tepidisphaeraceae bacterium]